MDNKYPANNEFRIYKITQSGMEDKMIVYGLINTHIFFKTYDLAKQWIEDEGERHVEYTIVEVYKKD